MVAVVFGPILAIPAAGGHFGLQVLARWMLREVWVLRPIPEMLLLNLPAIVVVGGVLARAYWTMSDRPIFETFVARPMPASVRVLGHGGGKINFAVDNGVVSIKFTFWSRGLPGRRNCTIYRRDPIVFSG